MATNSSPANLSLVPAESASSRPPAKFRPAGAPSLPASSGAFWGTRTQIVEKDTAFVRAHTAFLNERAAQHAAANGLMERRIDCEITANKLANINLIIAHEFLRGQHDRAQAELGWKHQQELAAIARRTELANARIAEHAAQAQLATLRPTAEATTDGGLTPQDVSEALEALPELPEETRNTIYLILKGLIKEKRA